MTDETNSDSNNEAKKLGGVTAESPRPARCDECGRTRPWHEPVVSECGQVVYPPDHLFSSSLSLKDCPKAHAALMSSMITAGGIRSYRVECEVLDCWVGPERVTARSAAAEWNTRAEAEDVSSLRAQLADEKEETLHQMRLYVSTRLKECKALEGQGEVWIWQGNEEDHPESLGCPVLMQPEDLRAILGAAERMRQACVAKAREMGDQYERVGRSLSADDGRTASALLNQAHAVREVITELESITLEENHEAEADQNQGSPKP